MVTGNIRTTLHGSQLRGPRLSLTERAALAQRCGYDGLDFSLTEARGIGDPIAVKALLAEHQLLASTIGGVLTASLSDGEETFAAALAAVTANAREVAALGGSRTGSGLPIRADVPKDQLWPLVLDHIRRVDAALDGTGVRLGLEFLGVQTLRLERPYPFVQSMAEANRLLDAAGARNVGLTLDSYHWYAAGDTLDTIRRTQPERLVLLHINDAKPLPREQLMDQDRLLPGEGAIPLVDWLRAIDETGFDGFLAIEVLGPRLAGLSPEESARVGIDSLRQLFAAAGLAAAHT